MNGGGALAQQGTSLSKQALLALDVNVLADIVLTLAHKYPECLGELKQLLAAAPAMKAPQSAHGGPRQHHAASRSSVLDEAYMVGSSPSILEVFEALRRCARSDAPVLVTGESGTGKELAALAIHERSDYANGPFVAVNCGGLPPELVASELFGHEKGAFTGAATQRIGRIEQADGGTLFLDEIGDLPLDLQAHMLRFLQDRIIQRVGGGKSIRVNTRIVAATNVDLESAVANGRFRQDLYFRLDVLRIRMPALRERDGDVPLLARYFLERLSQEMGLGERSFSPEAMERLCSYSWPGNVRELISTLRRALVMADEPIIQPRHLEFVGEGGSRPTLAPHAPAPATAPGTTIESLRSAKGEAEAAAVRQALAEANANVTRAAKRLGVSRVTFYKLMRKHNIERRGRGDAADYGGAA